MEASPAVKNVVLVHGGFVDGSGWQGVYGLLKNDSYHVSIVQNPTLSLAGRTKRGGYRVTTDDRMTPPPAQRAMSERAGSPVVESAGSHSIYLSQPTAVASLIEQAASAVAEP